MSEQKSPTPHAADESALSDESLESVAGGRSIVTIDPETLVLRPAVEPIQVELGQFSVTAP